MTTLQTPSRAHRASTSIPTSASMPVPAPTPSRTAAPSRVRAPRRVFAYGVLCYSIGISGLTALILAALGVLPLTGGPLELTSTPAAIAFNLSLVALFGIQHVIMARERFKRWWTTVIPAAAERPTFVLLAGLLAGSMVWLWQPLPEVLWNVASPVLRAVVIGAALSGWVYMLSASFAIDHFELFGLRQVWRNLRGLEPDQPPFRQRLQYRFDRHPIMTGMLIGLWCTPTMTLGHLVLAAGLTTYIVLGVAVEERDLVRKHGADYEDYRRRVRSVVPRIPGIS